MKAGNFLRRHRTACWSSLESARRLEVSVQPLLTALPSTPIPPACQGYQELGQERPLRRSRRCSPSVHQPANPPKTRDKAHLARRVPREQYGLSSQCSQAVHLIPALFCQPSDGRIDGCQACWLVASQASFPSSSKISTQRFLASSLSVFLHRATVSATMGDVLQLHLCTPPVSWGGIQVRLCGASAKDSCALARSPLPSPELRILSPHICRSLSKIKPVLLGAEGRERTGVELPCFRSIVCHQQTICASSGHGSTPPSFFHLSVSLAFLTSLHHPKM